MNASTYAVFVTAALLCVTGCDKQRQIPPESSPKQVASPSKNELAKQEKTAPQAPSAQLPKSTGGVEPPQGWTRISQAEMSEPEIARLQQAKSAQKMLGKTLLEELSTATAQKGFPEAIAVCNVRAPAIAEMVRLDKGVTIGRTSFRLRNPDNKPPAWAEPFVEAHATKPTVLRHNADHKLAYLAPIMLGELCVKCHGPADELAPGVEDKLAALYPEDQAIGFEPGELRGWFWVEVPEG